MREHRHINALMMATTRTQKEQVLADRYDTRNDRKNAGMLI